MRRSMSAANQIRLSLAIEAEAVMRPFLTLHDPATSRLYYERGLWRDDTFYSLMAQNAEMAPTALAIRDGRTQYDWACLKARVDALADNFLDKGIGAGDRIAVWMSNRVEAIIAFLACSRIGAACNPSLHRSYTCQEIIQLLTELQVVALVMEPGWGGDVDQQHVDSLLAGLPFLKKIYRPDTIPLHITRFDEPAYSNPDSVAYLAFTSGTTGQPKCVMHSSNTLLANARDLARDWDIRSSDVILTLSPLSHHIAWVAASQWLVAGCQFVIDDPPPQMSKLDWILYSNATYVLGVPTHAMDILAEARARGIEKLGNVRVFYMAGAPIPHVVAAEFIALGIVPQNVYGMTECSSHQYTHPSDPIDVCVQTCGRGGSAYEVKVWDTENADRELPQGQIGEIGGRGACMMLGYYANQAATHQSFNRHGYLMSGDLGSFDVNGNLRIEGRAKDLIIRGGHNIHPAHIEAFALTHRSVTKAAAFPISDERLGEKVCLAIIGDLGAEQMLEHLAGAGLSKFDMPEWFIVVTEFPLTASGKVLKRELVEMVKRGDLAPTAVRYRAKKVAC
jgi:acyl-CoA synthetase